MLSSFLSSCSSLAVSVLRVFAVLGFLGYSLGALAEGDIERGRVLTDTCKGCHAIDTYNNVYPTFQVPRIGGQSEEYIAIALKAYRAGERNHKTMTAQASSYSDQDIADIAAYITSVVPEITAAEPRGQAPESAATCTACHGQTGIGQISTYPYLAGQHQDYLEYALQQYRRGERKGANAVVMQAQIMNLTDAQLKEIAKYYAAQEGLSTLPLD